MSEPVNCAGESVGEACKSVTADLRVYLRGDKIGKGMLDDIEITLSSHLEEFHIHGELTAQEVISAARKMVLVFPESMPDEPTTFNIPAYIVNELRQALKESSP